MTSREFRQRLQRRARRFEVALTAEQTQALEAYFNLLVRWNARINLTALRLDPPDEKSFDRLLFEPLVAARYLPQDRLRLIDIGSGSGSPAVPLAVAHGQTSLTMVESKTRKSVFLMEVVRELGLDATVETARFEHLLSRPELHETFDVLSVRAVRVEQRTLLGFQAFLRPEGRLLWFASSSAGAARVPPPLRWLSTHQVVNSAQTHLIVLTKEDVGRGSSFHVER